MTPREKRPALLMAEARASRSWETNKSQHHTGTGPTVALSMSVDPDEEPISQRCAVEVLHRMSWGHRIPSSMCKKQRRVARRMLRDYVMTPEDLAHAENFFRVPVFLVGKGCVYVD